MWLRPPERMATLGRMWSWRTQLCTTAQSRRTNKISGRKWWDMLMSVILIMMEDGLDDHSQVSFFLCCCKLPPLISKWGHRRNLSHYRSNSHNHDLFKHCFLLLSLLLCIFCLFFSPLTLAQLKTELLGSKFNSILEETTVRFLNKPQ